ncbi:MAG: phenylalanine--tRNA ligase subunit alpha [Clostridia bacterium]|nr:phenylalanine--tRNA ligase subunit alpha [Clostridia bacterium]
MKDQIESIRKSAQEAIASVKSSEELEALRVKFLGKKGSLTALLRTMGSLAAEERPIVGAMVNDVRIFLENEVEKCRAALSAAAMEQQLANEVIDVTMPGKKPNLGSLHPLTQVLNRIIEIFSGMGFSVVEGPEIETDYYNFTALNIPEDHPARDTQDSFYITDSILLRTQTSTVQIRTMQNHTQKLPIRIISPGRVYRSDNVDATHSPVFTQLEGLVVDKGVTMADLKGTLDTFAKTLYGEDAVLRFRPHHFPFTEPSAEVDMSCFVCGGKGCSVCKGEGWIEILGAGMVHPKVLEECGIDSSVYSGFAFGVGLERITMRHYGIDDMRLLSENDMRFLEQF